MKILFLPAQNCKASTEDYFDGQIAAADNAEEVNEQRYAKAVYLWTVGYIPEYVINMCSAGELSAYIL